MFNNLILLTKNNSNQLNGQYTILKLIIMLLKQSLAKFLYKITYNFTEIELYSNKLNFLNILCYLKNSLNFKCTQLLDIIVIDKPGKKLRFQIKYLLLSIKYNYRLFLVIYTNELLPLITICNLYSNANWCERELWDFFGINFLLHNDLRRLLTDYGFRGFPLRKDFPLSGYVELFYNDTKKRIIQQKISLAQEYRFYNFKNVWIALK